MAINFSTINLEVLDLSTNVMPDLFINQNGVTFSKRILEDMNYPQNVQYCTDPAHQIFAIRVCKSNEAKSVPFSKTRGEQTSTLSCGNKNLHDVLATLIPAYQPKTRYKVVGAYDAENRVMYFDLSTAEISEFRAPNAAVISATESTEY
ncbi:hypothetical protein [Oscillibacter sp.]|uniref:hypothetical protein n=1 Tax=Oscillibacter sp. TaxID=1945593 RepID=UPI00262E929D|nr:hypothetical protein [Oscillibacter sp.]MDD3347472.1 hypothetical protein [Oscillibacter sp.]